MGRLLAVPLVLLLTACAIPGQDDINSSNFLLPAGSYLTLNQELEIPRDDTTVYIQYGRTMSLLDLTELQEWEPHCFLQLHTRSEKPQKVAPDRFEILRVKREVSELWVNRPVLMAYGGSDGGPTQVFYRTRYFLNSPNQPDVWRLSCQIDRMEAQGLSFDRWLTLAQTRETLDGVFDLILPGETPPG